MYFFKKNWEFFLLILNLENSPNSALEFAEFSKLNSWVWRILQTHFGLWKKHVFGILFLLNLSSGKSPNSTLEFGKFSKLNLWVCVFFKFRFFFRKKWVGDFEKICVRRFFSIQKTPSARIFCYQKNFFTHMFFFRWKISKLIFFGKKKRNLKDTHSEVESGEFSKLKGWVWRFPRTQIQKKQNPENMFFFQKPKWIWRILQTQVLSLENSPNSDSIFFFSEFGKFSKLKFKISKFIFFCKTMNWKKSKTQRLSLENSPNSMVENSPNSVFFQKHPQP